MYCSKCGAVLAEDAVFCQSCGTPVTRAAAVLVPSGGTVSPHAGVGAIVYASNVTFAGFWLRFVAYLLDSVIIGFAVMVLFVPFFFLMGGVAMLETLPRHAERVDPAQFMAFLSLIVSLAAIAAVAKWLYFAYLESGEKQATWGKQALGIYVTDLAGQRVTFGRATGRFLARMVSGLIPLGIGFIMAGFTERGQALHDMIASTLVLRH
ncbi:MAG TPA: RDD family protein [Terriglobales bacterium]